MRAVGHVRHVVREQQQTEVLARCAQRLGHGGDDVGAQALDGVDLVLEVVVVRGLVRALEVQGHEVVPFEHVQRGGDLGGVVGVPLAGRGRDGDGLKPRQDADAVAQRHGRDNAAVRAVVLREVRQRSRRALGPEPDAVGRELAGGAARDVDRVLIEDVERAAHQLAQHVGIRAAGGQDGADLLAEVVVRRGEPDALDVHVALHREVAERRALVDDHAGLLGQRAEVGVVKEHRHKLVRLAALDAARAVGDDVLVLERHVLIGVGDHVAAVARVAGGELYAGRRRLERGAAEKVLARRAAEDGHDGRVAAGGEALGHVAHAAEDAVAGEIVDRVLFRSFQRRAAAERVERVVGHAVADDENVFHTVSLFSEDFFAAGCPVGCRDPRFFLPHSIYYFPRFVKRSSGFRGILLLFVEFNKIISIIKLGIGNFSSS